MIYWEMWLKDVETAGVRWEDRMPREESPIELV